MFESNYVMGSFRMNVSLNVNVNANTVAIVFATTKDIQFSCVITPFEVGGTTTSTICTTKNVPNNEGDSAATFKRLLLLSTRRTETARGAKESVLQTREAKTERTMPTVDMDMNIIPIWGRLR